MPSASAAVTLTIGRADGGAISYSYLVGLDVAERIRGELETTQAPVRRVYGPGDVEVARRMVEGLTDGG